MDPETAGCHDQLNTGHDRTARRVRWVLDAPGMSTNQMAAIVADGLVELGYSRYTASGCDVGGTIAEILAAERPENVAALHLTNVAPQRAITADAAKRAPDAAAYLQRAAQWFRALGGYIAEQAARPNTLSIALGDSPAGLAAWIVEKLPSLAGPRASAPRKRQPSTVVAASIDTIRAPATESPGRRHPTWQACSASETIAHHHADIHDVAALQGLPRSR